MSIRDRPYLLFCCLAAAAYVVADIGFSVVARKFVAQASISDALVETLHYTVVEPIGSLMLLAPFALLGWMAASLAKSRTLGAGLLLFSAGAAALGLVYFWGHVGAEQAMLNRKWTAASLAIGLLPFQSLPILFVILIVRLLARRRSNDKEI